MALNFFQSATGDPQKLLTRFANQADPQVPATTGFVDVRTYGGAMGPARLSQPAQVLTGSPMAAAPLDGKFDMPAGTLSMGDVDAAGVVQMMFLANTLQRYTTTNPETGRYRHRFGQAESTAAAPCLTALREEAVGMPRRFSSVRSAGLTIAAAPRQNFRLQYNLVAGKHDYHSDATQSAGTGSSKPILRHNWAAHTSTSTLNIYAKVIADGSGSATFQFATGSSASYTGAPTIACAFGAWTEIQTADGRLGDPGEWVEMYLPADADLTADDVFVFAQRRTVWSPSYSVERRIAEIGTRLYVGDFGGALAKTSSEGGWQVQVAIAGAQRLESTGERQPSGTIRTGEQVVTFTLNRRMVDLDLQRYLENGGYLAVVLEGLNEAKIASTSAYYSAKAIMPYLRAAGPTWSVPEGGGDPNEALTLTAGQPPSAMSYGGQNYSSDITIELENGVASF